MEDRKYCQLEQELRSEGYTDKHNSIDAHVVAEQPCPNCGGHMTYIGLVKDESYRAIAFCNNCGKEEEF